MSWTPDAKMFLYPRGWSSRLRGSSWREGPAWPTRRESRQPEQERGVPRGQWGTKGPPTPSGSLLPASSKAVPPTPSPPRNKADSNENISW